MNIIKRFKKPLLPFKKIFLVISLNSLVGVTIEYLSQDCKTEQNISKLSLKRSPTSIKMPVWLFIFHYSVLTIMQVHPIECSTVLQSVNLKILCGKVSGSFVQRRTVLCHTFHCITLSKKSRLKIICTLSLKYFGCFL